MSVTTGESEVKNNNNGDKDRPATIQIKREMYDWMKALSYMKGMGGNLDELFEYFKEQELSKFDNI